MIPPITIIIDMNGLLNEQEASLVVNKVSDYPQAYLAIKEAIRQKSVLSLYVRNPAVATWLTKCAHMYGEAFMALQVYTPRVALAQRWQLAIPPTVTDRDILQSGLLEAHITPREGQDFWDALLEYFYDGEFAYTVFPLGNIAALINHFYKTRWEKAARRPLVIQAQRNRLEQWERNANSEAIRTIVQHLAQDPNTLRQNLIYYKVLQNYPSMLGIKVLGEVWETFRHVHMELDSLEMPPQEVEKATREIEYYLTTQREQIVGPEQISELLCQMSGYLYTEFDYIESLLLQHPYYLTPELLQEISQRFRPIRHTVEHVLTKLQRLLKPPFPQEPNRCWDVSQWLEWVTTSYMPYYNWLDAQALRDSEAADYAFIFADWLYKNFILLKNGNPEYFTFSALYHERERMLSQDTITFILIIDNLNYTYFDGLRQQFLQQDFTMEEIKPLLSLIPTATEVGKAALIAGLGDPVDLAKERYADLVNKAWSSILQEKKAKYLQNIGELQRERSLTHDVYFLNYLPIDDALHEDNRDTGRLHIDVIHEYFSSLVKEVANFAKRFQIENRLLIYVISDHGSTRIPQDIVNVIDQKYFKRLTGDKHHRFLSLSDENFASLPQVTETQCYLIDRQRFKTSSNYLIAQQYYRFIQTQENFYVHGGLTPEEVVVPFARFTHRPIIPEDPSLHLLAKEFRYAVKSKVELEVGNPNSFPLEALRIRLVDADADEVFIPILAPKQVQIIRITTIFRKAPSLGKNRSFAVKVRYECQGHQFITPDQTFEITLNSLMEVNDDDFDF